MGSGHSLLMNVVLPQDFPCWLFDDDFVFFRKMTEYFREFLGFYSSLCPPGGLGGRGKQRMIWGHCENLDKFFCFFLCHCVLLFMARAFLKALFRVAICSRFAVLMEEQVGTDRRKFLPLRGESLRILPPLARL